MSNVTYVKGDELTALANSLKSKGENINNEYKNNCSQALSMSTECLQASGLNTAEFFHSLDSIYAKLNQRINEVSDFLTNVVVAEYQALNDALVNNFNNKFANEMSGVLGLTGKPVGGMIRPVVRPGIVRPTPIGPVTPLPEPTPLKPINPIKDTPVIIRPVERPDAIIEPIKPGDTRYSEPAYRLFDGEYNPEIYHTTASASSYSNVLPSAAKTELYNVPLTEDLGA
jgi:hypothetical protein